MQLHSFNLQETQLIARTSNRWALHWSRTQCIMLRCTLLYAGCRILRKR